ncbi:MAG: amidohydrolase family protein [Sphaerochaetaceae bacterium]|nr:amidohydrolase family protein [Sphaerochaetaceae bacterium]
MNDLKDVPVLDNHSHFFKTRPYDAPLWSSLTLSLNDMPEQQVKNTLLYHDMIANLSSLFDMPAQEEIVLAERRRRMDSDYPGYIRELFTDVNLRWMLIDIGLAKSSVDFTEFESICPASVSYVYRSETLIDDLWKRQIPIDAAIDLLHKTIADVYSSLHFVAIKSIIGYRTGLRIEPHKKVTGEKSYRDILFKETAGICRELNVPFHVHAAFGESNLDLRENNPLHLKDFLDSSDAEGLKLVLIHGGYPYTFEAGYLAAMYPGIYVDISEFIPFASMGMRRGVEDILSMCPTNKILYGSDGFDVPETHWLGGRSAKETLSVIIMSLVERGKITSKYGQLMYHDILYRNSLTLHNIR